MVDEDRHTVQRIDFGHREVSPSGEHGHTHFAENVATHPAGNRWLARLVNAIRLHRDVSVGCVDAARYGLAAHAEAFRPFDLQIPLEDDAALAPGIVGSAGRALQVEHNGDRGAGGAVTQSSIFLEK